MVKEETLHMSEFHRNMGRKTEVQLIIGCSCVTHAEKDSFPSRLLHPACRKPRTGLKELADIRQRRGGYASGSEPTYDTFGRTQLRLSQTKPATSTSHGTDAESKVRSNLATETLRTLRVAAHRNHLSWPGACLA